MAAHALLSASSSKIWLNCTPAARAQLAFPDEESVFAREGTFGHALAVARLAPLLGLPLEPDETEDALRASADGQEFLKPGTDLSDRVDEYVARCVELSEALRAAERDVLILLEQRLDYSDWVPEGFGTGDLVIVTPSTLYVRDLKLGRNVFVDAEDNSQLKLYAAGALATYGMIYPFEKIVVEIDQPRRNNLGRDEFTRDELHTWMTDFVQPRAALAWNGEGEFVPGEQCTFCRARHTCRARSDAALAVAASWDPDADFAKAPPNLSDPEIAALLPRLDGLVRWANDLQKWALAQAVTGGKQWEVLKLVSGSSVRTVKDADGLVMALTLAGIDEALLYERALLGITDLEKLVGKKKFAELSADYVIKPPGKPALATLDDTRPAWEPEDAADRDFGGLT